MQDNTINLTDNQEQVLTHLYEHGGQAVGYENAVPEASSRSQAYQLVQRIDDRLLDIEDHPNGSKIILTDAGRQLAEDATPQGRGSINTEEEMERLHGLVVQVSIQGGEFLPEEWMAKLQERDEVDFVKSDDNDFIMYRDIWVHRFHKDSITLQLRDGCSIQAGSSEDAFQHLWQKIKEAGEWVEKVIDRPLNYSRVRLGNAELAFEQHHLAMLADGLPGLKISNISVADQYLEKDVVAMDKSPGFPELETMSGERAEEIGQTIEEELRQYVKHKDAVDFRHHFEREAQLQDMGAIQAVHNIRKVSTVQEQLQETITEVDSVESQVQDMRQQTQKLDQYIDELQQTRHQERELCRTNAQAVLEHEEEIEELQDKVAGLEVVQKLTEKVQQLEEKIEEVAESGQPDQGIEARDVQEETTPIAERPKNATLKIVEINTETSEGARSFMSEPQGDPSAIQEGLKFKDLRDDTLLEVQSIQVEERGEGLQDICQVRVCGTLKIWAEIPRREIARLLETGRFETVETPM